MFLMLLCFLASFQYKLINFFHRVIKHNNFYAVYVTGTGLSVAWLQSLLRIDMIWAASLLVLIYIPLSLEEFPVLQIPLRHSLSKFIGAEVESGTQSKWKHTSQTSSDYNLHGTLGQGYYIELAVGQPQQLVSITQCCSKNQMCIIYHVSDLIKLNNYRLLICTIKILTFCLLQYNVIS